MPKAKPGGTCGRFLEDPPCESNVNGEEVASSADEAVGNFCREDDSPVCSPTSSWRGSDRSSSNGSWRGSPSQRSQDSGYSDSGESNMGGQNEVDDREGQPPQVRHITRIYFGDSARPSTIDKSNNTDENEFAASFVPKTRLSSPSPRVLKMAKRKNTSLPSPVSPNFPSPADSTQIPNQLNRGIDHSQSTRSLCSPTTSSATDLEENDDTELEHKSLTDVSTLSPLQQPNQIHMNTSKTIFIPQVFEQRSSSSQVFKDSWSANLKNSSRNHRKVFLGKRVLRSSRKNEKLLEEEKDGGAGVIEIKESKEEEIRVRSRRPEPLKARRRWSASDVERSSHRDWNLCPDPPLNFDKEVQSSQHTTFPVGAVSSSRIYTSTLPQMSAFEVAKKLGNSSLEQWLRELLRLCESECMNTLQSKSLHADQPASQRTPTTREALSSIQRRAHIVSAEFALLCQRLEQLQLDQLPSLVTSLTIHIQTFIQSHCDNSLTESKFLKSKSFVRHQTRVVEQICERLVQFCADSFTPNRPGEKKNKTHPEEDEKSEENESGVRTRDPTASSGRLIVQDGGGMDRGLIRGLVQIVTALGHAFTKLVDILLSHGMKRLVSTLDEDLDEWEVERAVTELTTLGVNGGHVCRLVGKMGGIRALLGVCVEPRFKRIRALSLRALATVCCVAEGISVFEKEGGVDVISEVLCDAQSPEEERSEAAGVLAQITSPWVQDNHNPPCLKGHIEALVTSLTDLAQSTTSAEVFLLTSAALANLTFLDASCINALLSSSTHKILLQTVQMEEYSLSVFTKDQIATIFANMSSTSEAARQIIDGGGVEVLVALLQTGPSESVRPAEVAAIERVQQKSAIALSRICTDAKAANQVLTSGGAARLVHLCKNETERNQSDAVLVACLAALRKIAASCGHEELRQVDASELVEPRLLDSFLIYSSQQESFV